MNFNANTTKFLAELVIRERRISRKTAGVTISKVNDNYYTMTTMTVIMRTTTMTTVTETIRRETMSKSTITTRRPMTTKMTKRTMTRTTIATAAWTTAVNSTSGNISKYDETGMFLSGNLKLLFQ